MRAQVGRPSKYQGPHTHASSWQALTGQNGDLGMPDPMTKVERELFIGNTSPDMTELTLQARAFLRGSDGARAAHPLSRPPPWQEFLNAAMQQVGLTNAPGNPIVTTRLSGKFAFVEMRTIDEANNALNMNGIPFMGQSLRIGRPSKYTGPMIQHMNWDELLAKHYSGVCPFSLPHLHSPTI